MPNITTQLKALKQSPQAGWVNQAAGDAAREKLMVAIGGGAEAMAADVATANYYQWTIFQMITRPISVGVAVFALLLGGWMTTVSAASNSLPGDTLYGVKLVSERVQLSMSSLEGRAVLHTEFAQRRLSEVVALQSQGSHDRVRETVEALKVQLEKTEEGLTQLKEEDGVRAASIATAIDETMTQLDHELALIGGGVETSSEVDEARQATRVVTGSAVEAIVDAHEQEETDVSAIAIERSFKNLYRSIDERQKFDIGRAAMIEQLIVQNDELAAELTDVDLPALQLAIAKSTSEVAHAARLATSGGYRTAFELLQETDTALLAIEADLAGIEFRITEFNRVSVVEEVAEPAEAEVVQEAFEITVPSLGVTQKETVEE